jgi:hypothetical protein
MLPASADFTVAFLTNATLVNNDARFKGNHSVLGKDAQVTIEFDLPAVPLAKVVVVTVVGLVSRLESSTESKEGYAPIHLFFNDQILKPNYTMPGAGYSPNTSTFPVPSKLLNEGGTNTLRLQVASDARSNFWLYSLAVDLSPIMFADFTVSPIPQTNARLVKNDTRFQGNHSILDKDGKVTIKFDLPAVPSTAAVVVTVVGLVSRLESNEGKAPISLFFNSRLIAESHPMPGAGYRPSTSTFPVSSDLLLKEGENTLTLQVASDAQSQFWLYSLAVDLSPIMSVDFTVPPPPQPNKVTLVKNDTQFRGDHSILGNNGRVVIEFNLPAGYLEKAKAAMVTVVGLVSRLEPDEGYSPISLLFNNKTFISEYAMPGAGYSPNTSIFQVPPKLLTEGKNTFTLQVVSDARSYFWLYSLAFDLNPIPEDPKSAEG